MGGHGAGHRGRRHPDGRNNGTASWANGSGSSSKWAPLGATTFVPGQVVYADDTAPGATPTGPQQLYQAIGAGNLRAYVQGQDDIGHAALAN